MMQTDQVMTSRGGAGVWVFRGLLVAGAAFMVYTWFQPWWVADVAVLPGDNHVLLRPWGVQVHPLVRANIDESLFSMPFPMLFAGFMWTYLVACMVALAASLVVDRQFSMGRIRMPLATFMILLVGLSYLLAVGLAYGIGELKSNMAGINFIGKSTFKEPQADAKIKMVSQLLDGYWLALGAGPVLIVLSLLRGLFVRKPAV